MLQEPEYDLVPEEDVGAIPEDTTAALPPAGAEPVKSSITTPPQAAPAAAPGAAEPEYDLVLERGSFVPEAGKAVAGGAVETTGSVLRGAGAVRQEDITRRAREAARAKVLADMGYTGVTKIADLPPEKQTQLREALRKADESVAAPDITQDPFYKAGLATSDWGADKFKAAHDYENSWTRAIGEGFGSTAPYLAVGVLTGPAGLGGSLVAGGALGYAASAGDTIDRAVKAGATREQVMKAISVGGLPGLTEQAGAEALLAKIPLPVMGKVITVLGRIGAKALAEGGQEGLQQALGNIIEKWAYDPNQDIMEGVASAAGIGAIVGAPFGALPEGGHKPDDAADVSSPTQPEGTPADPAAAVGTPTPGDTGVKQPVQPAGADQQPVVVDGKVMPKKGAVPKKKTGVTDLPAGTLPPDQAAALTEEPAAETPAETPAAVETPVVEETPAAADVTDEDLGISVEEAPPPVAAADEGVDEETAQAMAEISRAKARAMKNIAQQAQEQRAQTTTPGEPNADLTAALKADVKPAEQTKTAATPVKTPIISGITPQPAAQPGPSLTPEQVKAGLLGRAQTMPEPAGTPEAAARRAEQVAETPVSDVSLQPAQEAPPTPIATEQTQGPVDLTPPSPPLAPATQEIPVAALPPEQHEAYLRQREAERQAGLPLTEAAAFQPTAAVRQEEAPTEAAAAEAPTPQPTPAPAPAGQPAAHTHLSRVLASRLFDRLRIPFADVGEGAINEAVDKTALAFTRELPPNTPPEKMVKQRLEAAVARVSSQLEKKRTEQQAAEKTAAAEEEVATTAAFAKQKATAKKALLEGKPQELHRRTAEGEKPSEAILREGPEATASAIKAEMAKPEAERDVHLMEIAELLKGRKRASREKHKEITTAVAEVQQRRAAAMAEKEAAKEAAKQAKTAEITKEVTKQAKSEEHAKQLIAEAEAEQAATRKRNQAIKSSVNEAIEATPPLDFRRVTMAQLTKKGPGSVKAYIENFIRAAEQRIRKTGYKPQYGFNVKRAPHENFLSFARELLDGKHPNYTAGEFFSGLEYLKNSNTEDLYGLISDHKMSMRTREHIDSIGVKTLAPLDLLGDEGTTVSQASNAAYEDTNNIAYKDAPLVEDSPAGWSAAEGEGSIVGDTVNPETTTWFNNRTKSNTELTYSRRVGGAQLINQVVKQVKGLSRFRGVTELFRSMHAKRLRQLVGDVEVFFVSADEMERQRGKRVQGTYPVYTVRQRASGVPPVVLINADNFANLSAERQANLVLHEMTHAATSLAMDMNLRGTRDIVEKLRTRMEQQLVAIHGDMPAQFRAAFLNADEFLVEAYSNPDFQELMADMEIPLNLRLEVGLHTALHGGKPTWWDYFTKAISNAIGMFRPGNREQSYLESMLAIHPLVMRSSEQQRQDVFVENQLQQLRQEDIASKASKFMRLRQQQQKGAPDHFLDMAALNADQSARAHAIISKAWNDPFKATSRWIRNKMTTEEQIRRSPRYWGGEENDYKAYAREVLKGEPAIRKAAEAGDEITAELADFVRRDPKQATEMADILYESTVNQMDSTADLGTPSNSHIKKGVLHTRTRALHRKAKARWDALKPEAQQIANKLVKHYREGENLRIQRLVRNSISQAIDKQELTLPTGVSEQDAIDWVVDGRIDRDVTKQDPFDMKMHAALGKTAKSLAGSKALRNIKGLYVPLIRRGKFFFTARHDVTAPPGGYLDPTAEHGNEVLFDDKAKVKAFLEADDPTGKAQVERVVSEWYDEQTGDRVTKMDANAKQWWRVHIQNRAMEMADSPAELEKLRQNYESDGFKTNQIAELEKEMGGKSTMLPQIVNRMINSINQSGASETTKKVQIAALVDMHIRQMSGNRYSHRMLKRRATKGFSRDLVHNTMTTNRSLSAHLLNLDRAPKLAKLEKAMDDYVVGARKGQYPSGRPFDSLERQAMAKEIKARAASTNMSNNYFGADLVRTINEVSFIRHLFTPVYTFANTMQTVATTWPVLAAKFGPGRATRILSKAFWKLGARATLGTGISETIKEVPNIVRLGRPLKRGHNYHTTIRDRIATDQYGPILQRFMDQLEELGFGTSSGLEAAELSEMDRTKGGIFLNRTMRIARALPEGAEALNRYLAGFATIEGAKLAGLSDDAAIDMAVSMVEKTQGGYATANNPAIMSDRWWKVPMQFKKYPLLYGQLYWGSVFGALNPHNDPAMRKELAKLSGYLTLTGIASAGVIGLPMMELAKAMALGAAALGLTGDDWESDENWMQEMLAAVLGDTWGEVASRGGFRLAGIDMTSRLGNNSSILFGEPRKMDSVNTKAWLLDLLMGAAGGSISDMGKAYAKGDYVQMLPLPKFMLDGAKAWTTHKEGTKTAAGRQVAKPISAFEAVGKALGFKPASEARQWETGGSGAASKEKKRMQVEKSKVLQEYYDAKHGTARQNVMRTSVKRWNREHPKDKIDMATIRKSVARRKKLDEEAAAL